MLQGKPMHIRQHTAGTVIIDADIERSEVPQKSP